MGLLKKIFADAGVFPEDDLTPPENKDLKRRAVRIGGSILNDIFFEYKVEGKATRVQVANLSTTGMLFMGGDFSADSEVEGVVGHDDENLKIKVRIVRKDLYMFGVQVIEQTKEYAAFMQRKFEIEFAAADASVVPAEKLKHIDSGHPIWIIAKSGYSIYLIISDSGVDSYTIHLDELLIERNATVKENKIITKFGFFTVDGQKRGEMAYKGSDLLTPLNGESREYIEKGIKFIRSVKGLSDEYRHQINLEFLKLLGPSESED